MTTRPITGEDLTGALPDTSGTRHLKGLDSALEIYRDAYGIPHVRARSFADAFFGQGYATAQDRLWHMDHDRRFAYGRWAEYGGPAAVPQDLLMRRLQVLPSVEADYQAVNDETRGMLDSFAAGVNAFIDGAVHDAVSFLFVLDRADVPAAEGEDRYLLTRLAQGARRQAGPRTRSRCECTRTPATT